jgi:hypothetical protein
VLFSFDLITRKLSEHEKFCVILYNNLLRQVTLARSQALPKRREMNHAKKHVVWAQRVYAFEEKIGQDSALTYMPFHYEEDRFYSDHVELSSILRNTFYLDVNSMETFKSFHFCDYEYLVEEEDFFEQAYGDSHIAPSGFLLHIGLVLAYMLHPVYLFWVIPFFFLYPVIIADIYELKETWTLFPYYNSSSVSMSRDNFQGEAPGLYYANRDYVFGYTDEIYMVPEITFLYEHDEDPFYHEDDGGGGGVFTYVEDSGFDDDFDGEYEILGPDDEFYDYDPFQVPYYDYPLYQWISQHGIHDWARVINRHFGWLSALDRYELDIVDEVLMNGTATEHGYMLREGDVDGSLEFIEDAGEVDEGTGEDYLHDHPALMERPTWTPIESHVSTIFFPGFSFYDEGEDDEEYEWSIQQDTSPDEMSDEDELDEDEDEPREFEEEHHETSSEFDDLDYTCDEDAQDLASASEIDNAEAEVTNSGIPMMNSFLSEMSVLASMIRLVRYLSLNKEIMTLITMNIKP